MGGRGGASGARDHSAGCDGPSANLQLIRYSWRILGMQQRMWEDGGKRRGVRAGPVGGREPLPRRCNPAAMAATVALQNHQPGIRDLAAAMCGSVKAMLRAVPIALFAVSLIGSPLFALYCNDTSEAAMACCQGDMANCNQPGKTEDCCNKKSPEPGDAAAVLLKAPAPLKVALVAACVASPVALAPPLPWTSASHRRASRTVHGPPPTATTVLRV